MSAIIHKFNSSTKSSSQAAKSNLKALISQIAGCLNEELSELVGRLFDGADDMLFQLAENADSNEDQNEYFDTMRMLRVERKNIGQNFAANLKSHLTASHNNENQNTDIADDELSLVDQDEMEELVAVSAMHSKAMSLYGEAVGHLEARIEFLSLKSPGLFAKDALAPKNICESFKDALADIELSTNNKLVLYKLFDQEVILHLETLYKKLNQLFIDQGVLPQIKLGEAADTKSPQREILPPQPEQTQETDAVYLENPTYNPGTRSTYSYNNGSANGAGDNGTGTSHGFSNNSGSGSGHGSGHDTGHGMGISNNLSSNTSANTSNLVNQFISGELTASGPGIPASFTTKNNAPSNNGMQYYDRRDVMNALSSLQQNAAQSSSPVEQINTADFKRALLADMGSRSGGAVTKQVNLVDEKTIDFIEMLFDAIIEDTSISEAITNLLLRLQIPVIKVAMLDKDFFANGEHPCRTTLNLIAYLGRGLSSKSDSLFNELNQVVETLLNDFDIDINSFEKASIRLEEIELEDLQVTSEKEKTTQKTALQTHAREVVLAELQYHVMNRVLPKNAQKLILKFWSTLMFHRYIKHGKNSNQWKESVNTVNKLIQLLQPVESSQAYNQLVTEKDEVLDNIHNSLLETRQNPVEIETEINNVFLSFENTLENSLFSPSNMANDETYFTPVEDADLNMDDALFEPTLDVEEEIVDPLQDEINAAREKIANLPHEVRPGVWFKVFNGEDSAVRRVKLSVIIMEEAKLIFVDRHGIKVIEKDAEDFTNELSDDTSQIIADHSAFDHALGMVINSLSATV